MVVLGVFVVVSAVLLTHSNEPKYQGRALSYWTEHLALTEKADGPPQADCSIAVQHIGTNAVPFLLRWIQYTPGTTWMSRFQDRIHLSVGAAIDVYDRRAALAYGSAHAFEALGPAGQIALPKLARLANDPSSQDNRYLYVQALAGIGTNALPALIGVITNRNNNARTFAMSAIETIGTNAEPAIPALLDCLREPDQHVAGCAASTLGSLQLRSDLVVPALKEVLQDERSLLQLFVINALARFGPEAREACPLLVRFLDSPDNHVRSIATNALTQIAPDMLTRASPH